VRYGRRHSRHSRAAIVSVIASMLLLILMARSRAVGDEVDLRCSPSWELGIESARGDFLLYSRSPPRQDSGMGRIGWLRSPRAPYGFHAWRLFDFWSRYGGFFSGPPWRRPPKPVIENHHFAGFAIQSSLSPIAESWMLLIPGWFIALVVLFPLVPWVVRRWRFMVRARTGRCVYCGYDLRHACSARCPECGNATFSRHAIKGADESPSPRS